jgi:hypothetical protein
MEIPQSSSYRWEDDYLGAWGIFASTCGKFPALRFDRYKTDKTA